MILLKRIVVFTVFLFPLVALAGKKDGSKPTDLDCPTVLETEGEKPEAIPLPKAEATAPRAPHLERSEVQAYLNFIKKFYRIPTAAEIKEMGVTPVPPELIFGSWGKIWPISPTMFMKHDMLSTLPQEVVSLSLARTEHVEDSIFDSAQITELLDVYYKLLKSWVRENNLFPPTIREFQAYLGVQDSDFRRYKMIFDRQNGLFLDFNSGFKTGAKQWRDLGGFLANYVDNTIFNDEIKGKLTEDIRKSQMLLVEGFVSGLPVSSELVDATKNLQANWGSQTRSIVPVITAPAYGLAGGVPERLSSPSEHRYVSPQSIFLQAIHGNTTSINAVALPNRALKPQTGLNNLVDSGTTMVVVHPQAIAVPIPSDTEYPSLVVTTGAINKTGFNVSNRAIGARVSAIQNELQAPMALILDKLTGTREQRPYGLEVRFRPRAVPFREEETNIQLNNGEIFHLPKGFADLNKFYGSDGKVYDLPILMLKFGDTHYPYMNRAVAEAVIRQFVDPRTCLKKVDGSPVDIYNLDFNDHFDNGYGSSHTEQDLLAQQYLLANPLESNSVLQLKNGLEWNKDIQYRIQETRGYTPYVTYNYSNHDYDRMIRMLKTGNYVKDGVNVAFYTKLKAYLDAGKNPFKEYLLNDIGVSYNDHVQILGPDDSFKVANMDIAHGHKGGVYGKPVGMPARRAAVGAGVYADTHVAMWMNQVYNTGHTTLPFNYAKGFYNSGFQAVTIITPVHVQVLLFMDGTFFGPETHGNPDLEFRPGFPEFKPLPVLTHRLPGQATGIEQWF